MDGLFQTAMGARALLSSPAKAVYSEEVVPHHPVAFCRYLSSFLGRLIGKRRVWVSAAARWSE